MHSSTLSYILVSALTSAVVALGIEWLAKPRLEARKERLLSARRARFTFESRLLRIEVIAAMWKDLPPNPAPRASPGERERLRAELSRGMAEVDGITRELVDEVGSYALTYVGWNVPGGVGPVPTLITRYVTLARGLVISDRTSNEKLRLLHDMTEPLRYFLFSGRSHLAKRIRALQSLPGVFDKVDGTAGDQAPDKVAD
jgi:hypothetical protein